MAQFVSVSFLLEKKKNGSLDLTRAETMEKPKGWEALSTWYDEKQSDVGDLWHRSLIDPVLINLVGDVKGKDVLDLGCGNGYLSRKFAREAAKVRAIDSSPGMIERAINHDPGNKLGIKYSVTNANNLATFDAETFDVVFANMTLMDIEDAEGAIKETSRVLRSGGKFVASLSHPCFDNGKNSAWILEKVIGERWLETRLYRRIRAYRHTFSEEFPWRISDSETGWTRGYHRPLNWYSKAFRSAGLAIVALEEPEPTKEFMEKESEAPWFLEVPLHIVFEVLKI
jgi:ubiquinone/menaquinone biosynthesis C-methylase UbiE